MFKETTKFADRPDDAFKIFLNKVIPRTKDLFNLIKKYIKNTTSYLKLVEYLEPFLVYPDDITFKQYENILGFLKEQISSFKQNLVKSEIIYNTYITNQFPTKKINNLLSSVLVEGKNNQKNKSSMEDYGMDDLTTSEAVRKIIVTDCGRLYYSIIAEIDIDLFQPINIDELIEEELNKKPEPESKEKMANCKTYVMAKYYIDIDELRADDKKTIYYDKKYDTTRYNMIEEFAAQQSTQSSDEFMIFVVNHLVSVIGMSLDEAQREAKSIIDKKREVVTGDYSYLLDDEYQPMYFSRDENNMWIKNEFFSRKKLNEIMFCNLKDSCINIKKKCGPIEINQKKIKKDLYKEILSQFDKKFHESTRNIHKIITESYNYNLQNIGRIQNLTNTLNTKNQTKKRHIANTLEERDIAQSPFENLRNLVLSQQDFIKKQKDIISFCDKYTRPYIADNAEENEYWFYCTSSAIPLILTFYKRLANAFYIGEYENVLEQIKAERGKLSDDGDKVVDRFSGFIISRIDYDDSEGYNEQGFKIVSRSVLDSNIEKIVSDLDFKIPDSALKKNTKTILNIITTLDKNLGISVNSQFDFIVNLVNTILDKYIPSQKNYEKFLLAARKKKKKKRQPTFEEAYNNGLMMTTLSIYVVVIQTMMPSIRTKKTFPTCSRSFTGYPLEGDGDTSGLQYVICAAINIARGSDAVPWNTLPRIRKKIGTEETINKYVLKIKSFMDSSILTNSDIKKKIVDKLNYTATHVETDEIPAEFDVKNWSTFLPPLKPVLVTKLHNISPSFKTDLTRLVEQGDPSQFQKISDLKSTIFYFSLHIQELIQRVINKKNILLFTLTNEPFIENSCCNDGSKHTLQYFINVEPNITNFNNTVKEQSLMLSEIENLINPPFIFDARNTRLVFPPISKEFSEKTIYKTFIKFCKYNSGITLSDDLMFVCGSNKSGFKHIDSMDTKIKTLKHEGKHYSLSNFYQLLNIINIDNIVFVDFNPIIMTSRLQVEHLIANDVLLSNVKDTPLENSIEILKNLFDSYEATRELNDEGVTEATNYLDSQLDALLNYNIIPFLSKHGVDEKYISFIKSIEKFKTRGDDIYISRDDETAFAESEFLKQSVTDILKIYPSIIINTVDYKNISIPKHWDLAPSHKTEIIKFIEKEFIPLQYFYNNKSISSLLKTVMDKSQNLLDIMNATPFYANIKQKPGEKRFNTLLNGKLLEKFMKFYFLYSINIYIEVLNEQQESLQNIFSGSESVLSETVSEDLMVARSSDIKDHVVKLIVSYLQLLMSNKAILNFSDIEVKEAVLKAAEIEKSKIVENLGNLSQEELQIEDIMKNQKLGKWGLGLSKAIYQYDKEQYEKERLSFGEETSQILQADGEDPNNPDLFNMVYEDLQNQHHVNESNTLMRQMGEDDDFGDMDGDEGY